jgi:hypothetical protein
MGYKSQTLLKKQLADTADELKQLPKAKKLLILNHLKSALVTTPSAFLCFIVVLFKSFDHKFVLLQKIRH